jgi:hypothetical protein
VIVLKPHALESGVLLAVRASPAQCSGVLLLQRFPYFVTNDRYAAKAATKPITRKHRQAHFGSGHPGLRALILWDLQRWSAENISDAEYLLIVLAPNRFRPVADGLAIRCRYGGRGIRVASG